MRRFCLGGPDAGQPSAEACQRPARGGDAGGTFSHIVLQPFAVRTVLQLFSCFLAQENMSKKLLMMEALE